MYHTLVLIIFLVNPVTPKPTDGLREYELLDYLPIELMESNDDDYDSSGSGNDAICTVGEGDVALLSFSAFKRNFTLHLQKICESNESEEELLSSGDTIRINSINKSVVYYQGYIEGDSNSTVDGTLEHGVFQGVIITETNDKFIIERLNPPINGAHSLIYRIQTKQQTMATLMGEGSGLVPL